MKNTTSYVRLLIKSAFTLIFIFNYTFSSAQIINTYAGNGVAGSSGDGGPATAAELNMPTGGVAQDAAGNLYIAVKDNNRIRFVNSSGVISTIAGNGDGGYYGDAGQATSAELSNPYDVAVDASGNIYIADASNNRIRKVNTTGIIKTIAGNGIAGYTGNGGQATAAEIDNPLGVAVDASGNVYVAEQGMGSIREINISGIISTVAGNGIQGYSGDGGQATAAEVNQPYALTIDASGNIYIADEANHRVREVNTSGIITTIAGNGVAGNTGNGGQATSAEIGGPTGVAVDASGNIYIADAIEDNIRKVNTSGVISKITGYATAGYSGDGGQATMAEINTPHNLAFDNYGNLYVADDGNNRVRIVYLTLTVASSVAANVTCNGGSTGSASVAASNGTTPYTYSWSGGQTTSSVTTLSAGTFTITVTDADAITGTATVTITQPTALSVTPGISANVSCYGESNGSISLSVSGGVSPYTYSWSPGSQTTASITGQSAGTYDITVTDHNGCATTATATITQPAILTADACIDESTSTVTGSALESGGTSPYTYSWSPITDLSCSTCQNPVATPTTTTTYTVTITDNNGCTATSSATLNVNTGSGASASSFSTPPVVQWTFTSPSTLQSNSNAPADWIYSMVQITNTSSPYYGGYIAAGYTQANQLSGSTGTIPVILVLDPSGNLIWEKTYAPSIFNYSPFSGPLPYGSGNLVSYFVNIHEVYDNGTYSYVAVGTYADGYLTGFPPISANTVIPAANGGQTQNRYTYVVAITDNGNTIADASNTCFPSLSSHIKEFWGYSLIGSASLSPEITFPPHSISGGSLGGNIIGNAIDNIVENCGYASIRPVYKDASSDLNGYVIANHASLYTKDIAGNTRTEAMLIKLDTHLNLDGSFGEGSNSPYTGYELYTDNTCDGTLSDDDSRFQGVTVINNYSSTPSFVASGLVSENITYSASPPSPSTDCAYIINIPNNLTATHSGGSSSWVDLFSTTPIAGCSIQNISGSGGLLSLPAFTTNVNPVTTCSCTIAANNQTTSPQVEDIHIGTPAILANVWCNYQQPFNVSNYFPLIGGNDYDLTFQNVVLRIDSSNGTLISTTGAPNGAVFAKQFEGIDYFSMIAPTADGGYAIAGDLSFNTPQIPDDEIAYPNPNEHLLPINNVVKFNSTDSKQWDQIYFNNYEPSTSEYCGQNCMFGFIATSDGGYIIGGNNELNGDDYYATKLQPPPCSGPYTTAVSQLNSNSITTTTLNYGAIIGSGAINPVSIIGPQLYSSNEVWSGNYFVQGFVDILPGYTLTIAPGANIQFANKTETGVESKIVVEPGASLEVYGTISSMSSCINEMWDGIELRGQVGLVLNNSSQTQSTSNMGEVIMEGSPNAGTLSNSNLGIFTMKINVDQTWDFGHTGGIIIGEPNANFINNTESVDMQAYKNPAAGQAFKNLSTLTECNFQTTTFTSQPIGFPATYGPVHVCLNRVYGVGLYGNTFQCNEPYPTCYCAAVSRGIGIQSYDAMYTVDEYCAYISLFTGCGGPPNLFEDLQYGIKANADINPEAININHNTFTNNVYDILIEGAGGTVISNNTFTKSSYGNEYALSASALDNIYIDGGYPYTISGNSFSSTTGLYPTPKYWSTVVTNTINNAATSIDNNTYTGTAANHGLIVGIQPQGNNPGITMNCNTFVAPIGINDIGVMEYGTNQGVILEPQGEYISHGIFGTYFNNTFSHTSVTIPSAFDYFNTDLPPVANPGDPTVIYNYSPGTGPYSTNNLSATSCYPSNCSTLYPPPNWSGTSLLNAETRAKHEADSLTSVFDSGNAVHLYRYISAGYTSARLQDSMLVAGSYLSDGIMEDIIALNMPFDTLRNILVPNAPLDHTVKNTLDASGYYTPADTVRIDTITGISARTQLQQNILFSRNQASLYQNDLIMYYMNDTISAKVDSAINALYGTGSTLNDGQLAELASLQYQNNNDTTDALSTIASLSGDATYTNFCTLMPIVMRLQNKPGNVYALKGRPTDSATIAGIAMDTMDLGYAQARSLLEEVYNEQFADPIIIDTLSSGGHRPVKHTNGNSSSDSTNAISSGTLNTNFKLYPNPANNNLTIAYSLSKNAQEVTLIMYDVLGNKVANWSLPPGASNNTIVNENISFLVPGMYFYSIFENNKVVQRNKLVIER